MTATVIQALWSHWRRHPLHLATVLLGIALATGLWSAVQAINGEARASYARAAEQLDAGPVLTSPTGPIDLATYVELRRAGWQVSPVLEGRLRLDTGSVTLLGVDFLSYPAAPTLQADGLEAGDVLTGQGRLFARPDTAARLAARPNLPPVINSDRVPPGTVLTDIGVAARLLDQGGEISRMIVLPDQPAGLMPLTRLVPKLALSQPDPAADTARLTQSFHLNLSAFGLLSFAVGLFIVHGAIGLAFEQRRGMFRTLRALGLPTRHLTVLVMAELLVFAVVAGALGLLIGYLVAAALLPDVAATLRGLYGAPATGDLHLRPGWFASGLAMAVTGTFVAGAQGLWRLASLSILAAPGALAWSGASTRQDGIMALAGLVLLAVGMLVVVLFDGLIAGFLLLAGLLLGAALVLPWCLSRLLGWMAGRARSVMGQWIWADMRAQLPGLSLALMALLLALATNIGVGTMVSSFRLTFTGWLDQRLASELYVTARSDEQAADIRDWLGPRSDAVLPIRFAETTLNGQPARIYGIADHATYRDHWPLIAAVRTVWDDLAAGRGALINEQLARSADLWPGATVTAAPGWQIEVVGVYSDYGNPNPQMITGLETLLTRFPNIADRQYGVRVDPARAPELAADLRQTFDLPARGVVDQAGIKAASLGIFDKTFVVTGALNILTLGVAAFAILTSLLTLWSIRLPQLAPAWAMGLTRVQLSRIELARSLCLSGLTALFALPLGLLLAWVLLAIINVEAFGWRLPMQLFPLDWLWLLLLALLAGALAAALPARRLSRMPPGDLLRVFANER